MTSLLSVTVTVYWQNWTEWPSLLWHCWLSTVNDIWPVKTQPFEDQITDHWMWKSY